MKLDEFAFFNQQLASMLRDGLPLEGALRHLAQGMRQGAFKTELTQLETDLAKGAPLTEAITRRNLPELYKRMVLVGAQGNNLPGVLALLADYYHTRHNTLARLKGLMVYPLIVLVVAFLVSAGVAWMWSALLFPAFKDIFTLGLGEGRPMPAYLQLVFGPVNTLWVPPVVIGLTLILIILAASVPNLRGGLRWRLPAFKDSNLSQSAAMLHLLLKSGISLPDALGLLAKVEVGNRAGQDLNVWRSRIAGGVAKFADIAKDSRAFPPLFVWLVANAGEDLASGFQRAASIYAARARHRTEMFLYAALPTCVLMLGFMIMSEAYFTVSAFFQMFSQSLGE